MLPGTQEIRLRLAEELTALRADLPRDPGGDVVPLAVLTDAIFERLAQLVNQHVACVLVGLSAQRQDSTEVLAKTSVQADLMVSIALQRLGDSVRRSDLVVRAAGDQLAWLLPGAGALEARGLAQRLQTALSGAELWLDDQPATLLCRAGTASSTARRPFTSAELLRAAARDRNG